MASEHERCGPGSSGASGPRWVLRGSVWSSCGRAVTVVASAIALAVVLCGCSGGRDPERYVEDLGSEKESVRTRAVDELVRTHEEAMPVLVEALKISSDTERGVLVLKGVLQVLTDPRGHRSQESLDAVGSKITDPNREVRLAAIRGVAALAEVRKSRSTELLRDAMKDTEPECVRAAAEGLAALNFDEATRVLEGHVTSGDGIQGVLAAEALYRYSLRPSEAARFLVESISSPEQEASNVAQEAALRLGTRFVPVLVGHALQQADARVTEEVLGRLRDALFGELNKSLSRERMDEILGALSQIGDRESTEKLLEVVSGGGWSMSARLSAAEVLGVAAASARPAGGPELRGRIIGSLKEILLTEGVDERVRIGCAISLSRLREMVGAEYLFAQLGALEREKGETPSTAEEARALTGLRIGAQEALTLSGEFVVPSLIRAVQDPTTGDIMCWAAASTLGDLRVKKAASHLGALLMARTSPQAVRPRSSDPVGKFPLEEVEEDKEGPEAEYSAAMSRLLLLAFGFPTLTSLVVILGVLAVFFKASARASLRWKPVIIAGLVVLSVSCLIGILYRGRVKKGFVGAGAAAEHFAPNRQAVLAHVFGYEEAIPSRDPAVRIASARALGRIGGPEAAALLVEAREAHEKLCAELWQFIDGRASRDLVPANLAEEEDRYAAAETVDEIAQAVMREQEGVLFYIRQAMTVSPD